MAEILLRQNLVDEARLVVEKLLTEDPDNPRVTALADRIENVTGCRTVSQIPVSPKNTDIVSIQEFESSIRIEWGLTEEGLTLAKRKVRYSGRNVLRLFSAVPGPRGVRTSTQDLEIAHMTARLDLSGLPQPAVHVAAVGFLANTGEFVPLAQSEPLMVL